MAKVFDQEKLIQAGNRSNQAGSEMHVPPHAHYYDQFASAGLDAQYQPHDLDAPLRSDLLPNMIGESEVLSVVDAVLKSESRNRKKMFKTQREARQARERRSRNERLADAILPLGAFATTATVLILLVSGVGQHRHEEGRPDSRNPAPYVKDVIPRTITLYNVNGIRGNTLEIPWDAANPGQQEQAYYELNGHYPNDPH